MLSAQLRPEGQGTKRDHPETSIRLSRKLHRQGMTENCGFKEFQDA